MEFAWNHTHNLSSRRLQSQVFLLVDSASSVQLHGPQSLYSTPSTPSQTLARQIDPEHAEVSSVTAPA